MDLTSEQKKDLDDGVSFIESHENLGVIPARECPRQLIQALMASDCSDLAIVGCMIASRMDSETDLSFLQDDSEASRNYARLLLSERPVRQAMELPASPVLQSNIQELAARIVQAPATGQAATATSMTIIVHGTFAATSKWWQQGGAFWRYIDGLVPDLYSGASPFSWSGANRHAARLQGARGLVAWAQANPATQLRIIAHSHGGNVCLVAARLGLKIDKLILLGAPIRQEYLPDPSMIGMMHNVFSTGDRVQKVGTSPNRRGDGRTLPEHASALNTLADNNGIGYSPGHSELHDSRTWNASRLNLLL